MTVALRVPGFRHEAVFYRGADEFLDSIASFVRDGIAAGEPTMVMVSSPKIAGLRERIGSDGGGLVEYRDMEQVGANPARIIPAWDHFARERAHVGTARMRGVGEPVWPGRDAAEMEECHWHEALINRAFAQMEGFWLICPYDVAALDPGAVQEARTTHPLISEAGAGRALEESGPNDACFVPAAPLASPLAAPQRILAQMAFDDGTLGDLRELVAAEGARAGLPPSRLDDLILSVSEVATNSITHGGGHGIACIWVDGDDVVCEISDRGVMGDPLIDRRRPGSDPLDARGLWTANQLCDLVQLRSSDETGSIVRLLVHGQRPGPTAVSVEDVRV